MSSSLSKKRSIALSYGVVVDPTPTLYIDSAHVLACRILNYLWHNWGSDKFGLRQGEVDLYSVNVPLIEELLASGGLKVYWTTLWRNSYGRLFENVSGSRKLGPATQSSDATKAPGTSAEAPEAKIPKDLQTRPLLFKWSPDIDDLINPTADILPIGSDGWAIHNGSASVTPLNAAFAESYCIGEDTKGSEWKMKF